MIRCPLFLFFFFFNDTATTEIYTLSLHDALPIWVAKETGVATQMGNQGHSGDFIRQTCELIWDGADRKSTRLNSSHTVISYAVFCLKKKKQKVYIHSILTCTYQMCLIVT